MDPTWGTRGSHEPRGWRFAPAASPGAFLLGAGEGAIVAAQKSEKVRQTVAAREARGPADETIADWRKVDGGRALLDRADRLRDQIEDSELWRLIGEAVAATTDIDTGFPRKGAAPKSDWPGTCARSAALAAAVARTAFEMGFEPRARGGDVPRRLFEALRQALGADGLLIVRHQLDLAPADILPPDGQSNEAARRMAEAHRKYPGDLLQLESDGRIARFTAEIFRFTDSPPVVADAPKWKPLSKAEALTRFLPPETWSSDPKAFLNLALNWQRIANAFAACAAMTNAELANHRPAGRTGIPERQALIVWALKNGLPAIDADGARRKLSIERQLADLLAALAIPADGNRVPSPMDRNGDGTFRHRTERDYRAAVAAWPKTQGRRHYDLLHHVMRQKGSPRGKVAKPR